jgi:competence protein ComEC
MRTRTSLALLAVALGAVLLALLAVTSFTNANSTNRVVIPQLATDEPRAGSTAAPSATSTAGSTATPTPTSLSPTQPPATPTPGGGNGGGGSGNWFTVAFLDVGQGDAILITINGERLLIDGGASSTLALTRLQALGVTDLDAILMTHPDADHIGGLAAVLGAFTVERIYLNGGTASTDVFATFMAAVNAEGAEITTLSRGMTVPLGGLSLPVLHPVVTSTAQSNDNSLVVRLTCGSVLFTGDAEVPAETSMLSAGLVTDVDVLKVGHHGSKSSSSLAFLQAAKPEVAVISAGRTNSYGHPATEVLDRLAIVGASLVYTDTTAADDTVVMSSDCSTYSFSTGVTPPPSTPTPTPATPTPTPTSSSTATPTPTSTATPGGGGGVTITSITRPIKRGLSATLTASTYASANCTIVYVTPSGTTSSAAGLSPKTADPAGDVSWMWTIGGSTTPGTGTVTVTCNGQSASTPIEITS